VSTNRLETFADGVFAIAATLLILNVDTQVASDAAVGSRLLHIWPSYAGYVVSFLTIGIIWANHHTVMNQIARVDRTFLMLSVLFLMSVAFIPFPTRLVAEHIRDDGARAATIAYGITLTLVASGFNAIWFYAATAGRLLREDADEPTVRGISRTYRFGPVLYLAITLVAAASPPTGAALFGAFALFWLFESSLFGRDRAQA
jgi:uncharacterized membrane protein